MTHDPNQYVPVQNNNPKLQNPLSDQRGKRTAQLQ